MRPKLRDPVHGCTVLVGHIDDEWFVKFQFSDGTEREVGPLPDQDAAMAVVNEFDQRVSKLQGIEVVRIEPGALLH